MNVLSCIAGIIFGGIVGAFLGFTLPILFKISNFEGGAGYAAIYFTLIAVPVCSFIIGYFSYKYSIMGAISLVLSIVSSVYIIFIFSEPENTSRYIKIVMVNNYEETVIASSEDVSSKSFDTLKVNERVKALIFPLYEDRKLSVTFEDENEKVIAQRTFIPYSMDPPEYNELVLEVKLQKDKNIIISFSSKENKKN